MMINKYSHNKYLGRKMKQQKSMKKGKDIPPPSLLKIMKHALLNCIFGIQYSSLAISQDCARRIEICNTRNKNREDIESNFQLPGLRQGKSEAP